MSYLFDHRQLADEMDLFFIDEQVGAGLPIWLPNGVVIRDELEKYIKDLENKAGYQRVVSPHLAKEELYIQSGHLQFFKEDMYPSMKSDEDKKNFYLRPMNCPHHHKIFASRLRSYRELPLRLAEYGQVYRYERSGSLRGLSRVRGLCQNDAHIYVSRAKAQEEIENVLLLHERCYKDLGLSGYHYRLSKHDALKQDVFQGSLDLWQECESILRSALQKLNLNFFEAEGEAAFYGPKIDVQMKMGEGKEESIASVQLDFLSANRFELAYIGEDGESHQPWIIHRAPLGSHERFIAMLLEYYDGQLPAWLCPIQVAVIPVHEAHYNMAFDLQKKLQAQGVRCYVDQQNGSLSKRIHFLHKKRPFIKIVIGEKELQAEKIKLDIRGRDSLFLPIEEIALQISMLCSR